MSEHSRAPDPAVRSGWRGATGADLEGIVRLMRNYYAEDGYPFQEREAIAALDRLLGERERGQVWVAERQGRIAGYAVLTLGYSLEYRGVDGFVDEIYLTNEARGSGLGSQALSLIEAECIQRGVRALHLEVERDKTAARELYRKRGFRDHQRFLMTKLLR